MREKKFRLIRDGKIVGYERHILRPQCGDDNQNVICICHETPEEYHDPKHYPTCLMYDKNRFIWHDCKNDWTGLKDRKGVEIWEGDVARQVNFYNGDVYIGPIEFAEDGSGWFIKLKEHHPSIESTCEVIGNIYENPELLQENSKKVIDNEK